MPRRNEHDQPIGQEVPDWQTPPAPPAEPINGRFCRLEPLRAARHADALYAQIAADDDPASWTYLGYGPFTSAAAYRAWVAEAADSADPLFFAIVDAADDRPIGVSAYLRIDAANGAIEIGHLYFTHRLQRTPAATETIALLIQRAYELGYRRYEWKCDALNAPSQAAARRFGFHYEGVFRQAAVYKGRNRDTAWFSIVDREWPAIARAFETWLAPANFDAAGRQIRRLADFMPANERQAASS